VLDGGNRVRLYAADDSIEALELIPSGGRRHLGGEASVSGGSGK
jgi:hypothetical protein